MEQQTNPFDEFLKETLKGHQLAPPEEAKKAFIREASAIINARKGWQNWYYFPILILILLCIVAVFYIPESKAPAALENLSPAKNSFDEPITKKISDPVKMKTEARWSTYGNPAADNPDKNQQSQTIVAPENSSSASNSGGDNSLQQGQLFSATATSRLALDSLEESGRSDSVSSIHNPVIMKDTMSAPTSPENAKPGTSTVEKQESYFTASVYYLPEWVFNTSDGTKFLYTFGVEGTYYLGPFSISTGAGISVANDVSKMTIEYNDYLGSYNKLDSISFTFNDQAHNFTPKYYMSSEKVWDTVPLLDNQELKMRYTYLRIPLVLGYDFWQKGRFSLGVRLGTAISLLLNSRQLSENYNPGDNKVINVYKITPDYISVNCQVTGGLNASVRMADNLYFEIDPMATYFYNSVYESPGNSKMPIAVGFRTAVLYKF